MPRARPTPAVAPPAGKKRRLRRGLVHLRELGYAMSDGAVLRLHGNRLVAVSSDGTQRPVGTRAHGYRQARRSVELYVRGYNAARSDAVMEATAAGGPEGTSTTALPCTDLAEALCDHYAAFLARVQAYPTTYVAVGSLLRVLAAGLQTGPGLCAIVEALWGCVALLRTTSTDAAEAMRGEVAALLGQTAGSTVSAASPAAADVGVGLYAIATLSVTAFGLRVAASIVAARALFLLHAGHITAAARILDRYLYRCADVELQ